MGQLKKVMTLLSTGWSGPGRRLSKVKAVALFEASLKSFAPLISAKTSLLMMCNF
jgi:hypothetical protein